MAAARPKETEVTQFRARPWPVVRGSERDLDAKRKSGLYSTGRSDIDHNDFADLLATRKLMTRFYDALLGPEAAGDVAGALQAAMNSMLREGYTVREWAAFVVYGLASATELCQV